MSLFVVKCCQTAAFCDAFLIVKDGRDIFFIVCVLACQPEFLSFLALWLIGGTVTNLLILCVL